MGREQTIDGLASDVHQPRPAVRGCFLSQAIGVPSFKNNCVDFVAAKSPVLLGGRIFEHALGTGCRPSIRSEDDLAGKVIPDAAGANADALATQILEVIYAGIGASDDGECFRVKRDDRAQPRIGPSGGERPLSMDSRIGDVGLRKAKRGLAALDAPDVRHRAIRTQRDTWHALMLAFQIKEAADRISNWMIDTTRDPGGNRNRVWSEPVGARRAACNGTCYYYGCTET